MEIDFILRILKEFEWVITATAGILTLVALIITLFAAIRKPVFTSRQKIEKDVTIFDVLQKTAKSEQDEVCANRYREAMNRRIYLTLDQEAKEHLRTALAALIFSPISLALSFFFLKIIDASEGTSQTLLQMFTFLALGIVLLLFWVFLWVLTMIHIVKWTRRKSRLSKEFGILNNKGHFKAQGFKSEDASDDEKMRDKTMPDFTLEGIEDELDLRDMEVALAEHKANPDVCTHEEIKKELGL